ncbi:MAG: DNA translocase FtsK [Spirochaetes bacterium]|nr:DNA translocase FtsK [Spirochaetota bacterium]
MFTEKRYQEAAGILIILFSIIILLSIFSFNINDFELLAGGKSVKNIMGVVGAYLGDFLRGAFGYSSYLLFVVMAVAGWRILRNGTVADVLEKILSLFFLILTSSMLFSLIITKSAPHFSGGYIGLYLSGFLVNVFNDVGAYLIAGILNVVALILLGIISFSAILEYVSKNENVPAFLKDFFTKLFMYQIRKEIPLNHIDEAVKSLGKKPPWIIRKRVVVENPGKRGKEVPVQPKLIEFNGTQPDIIKPLINDDIIPEREYSAVPVSEVTAEYPVVSKPEPCFYDDEPEGEFEDRYEEREEIVIEPYSVPFYEVAREVNGPGLPIVSVKDDFIFGRDTANYSVRDEYIYDDNDEDKYDEEEDYVVPVNTGETSGDRISVNRIRALEAGEEIRTAVVLDEKIIDDEEFDDDTDEDDDDGFGDEDETGQGSLFSESAFPRPEKVFNRFSLPRGYSIPPDFLDLSKSFDIEGWKSDSKKTSEQLIRMLFEFGIEAKIVNINRGPVLTLYEIQIAPGIKVNRIVSLSDDIAMALAASRVRVVAPIPGKSAIGIEVPNRQREMVTLGDVITTGEYKSRSGGLKVGLGKDILGVPITVDLKKLPHLLIAGATGSGKSVCVNSIITSLLYNYDPNHVRFILIDPKMVELQLYNGMPHLITPVITENHVAPRALKWAMLEMERRYRILSEQKARDIDKYNAKIAEYGDKFERLPYIVVIIDELADLMMIAAKEVEGFITRIAQKARAVGIHLVLATQRPSVNIITGVIKANFPARIAFQVAQKIDSRTIIDQNGAEKLLGKGDMLYQSPTNSFPVRVQGAFISEEEISRVVNYLKGVGTPSYIEFEDSIFEEDEEDDGIDAEEEDRLFAEALKIVEETKKASASYLQRRLSIGYNRAARIIEMMEDRGYIGPQQGSKPREVFI